MDKQEISGMDRIIEKKKWTIKKVSIIAGSILVVMFFAYQFIFADHSVKLNVQTDRISIEEVKNDYFLDNITITGTVQPITTVYLDALEGGRVEEILIEEGSNVKEGDIILRLSNTNLHMSIMNREADLADQMNNLRTTRLQMEQNKLSLKSQLLETRYLLATAKRNFEQAVALNEKDFISPEEFKEARDDYEYYRNKVDLVIETQKQDSLFRQVQIEQLEDSVERMQENLRLVQTKLENLNVRAPVNGQLAWINAEIGEAKSEGERLGQINILDSYKISAEIDEHYISRVVRGLHGQFEFTGNNYDLELTKIHAEVQDGRFDVDMVFSDKVPPKLRIGQTFRVKLELGEPRMAILIPRGGFFQTTGGQWIFVVDESGDFAVKRDIRINRQNSKFYEVSEGLEPGEKVIVSSYENFGDVDKLILK